MSRGTFIERPLGASTGASPSPASSSVPRRISVVVPVYNGEHLIAGCLAALDAQTIPSDDYEVLVVDDGSTDGTRSVVVRIAAASRMTVTLIEQVRNAGPAAARNAGLERASAPLVAFTDADVEVAPDWLAAALARFAAEPTIAGVEGATLPKGTTGTFTHQMENTRGQLYMTCNMIYRRDSLEGGFDERFRLAFLEDSDLAFRVLDAGGVIVFAPEVLAHHLVLQEGRRKFWREARKRFYNPLLYRKHPVLYRRLLKPVVPAFPAHYIDYLLAVAVESVALGTQAWPAATVAALLVLWTLKRVAFSLKARTPGSIAQAALVPFAQTFWAVAGMIRFRSFSPRI